MKQGEFSEEIIKLTEKTSQFETARDYLSLSNAVMSIDDLVNQFFNGFESSRDIRLKCYKGYQMEQDLMKRIKLAFGDRVSDHFEISAYEGLVKGHPDFKFDSLPGDCKSVLMDEWFPKDGKLSKKIYWQMQAYMLYSETSNSIVVFESRESGKIQDYWIRSNQSIQREIYSKYKRAAEIVRSKIFKSRV